MTMDRSLADRHSCGMPHLDDPARLLTPVDPAVDHWRGGAEPETTVVVYGDFECPYTRMAYRIVQRHEQRLGDRLRLVYRHFPLTQIHPHAERAAEAAEAAAQQGRYWEMHDVLFHNQKALEPEDLRRYAQETGLDLERYDAAMAEPEPLRERIARDVASGLRNEVQGTPTIFVDDLVYDGPLDPDALGAALGR
jgi:formate-nitrite transporter family protein